MNRRSSRSRLFLALVTLGAALFFIGFVALGTWQLHRRVWKLDLIARVESRVHAPPVPAPDESQWGRVSAASDEYRRVLVSGVFLNASEALVQAVTDLGPGYWVLTPLRLSDGSVILINRGFVPPEKHNRASRRETEPLGVTRVTGLIRMTEPRGGFLRNNDVAADRWYSRDVQAIAASRGLSRAAPFFIDEDGSARSTSAALLDAAGRDAPVSDAPVGGLTVITFHNNHLMYAITWYTLALMVAVGILRVWREPGR